MRKYVHCLYHLGLCWALSFPLSIQAKANPRDSLRRVYQHYSSQSRRLETSPEYLALLQALAQAYYLHHSDSTHWFAQKALTLSKAQNDLPRTGKLYNLLGNNYYTIGDYEQALRYYLLALQVWQKLNNPDGLARTLNSLGLIYESQGDYRRAIQHHQHSIRISQTIDEPASRRYLLSLNHLNLGLAYKGTQQNDSAAYFFTLTATDTLPDITRNALLAQAHLANLLLEQEAYQAALQSYQRLLIHEPLLNRFDACFVFEGMAKAYLQRQQPVQALKYANKALQIAQELRAHWEMQRAALTAAEASAALGDFTNAYMFLQLHRQYNDSVYNLNKEKRIRQLKTDYQASENERLAQEKELQLEVNKRQRYGLIALSILLVSLSVVAIFLVYLVWARQAKNQILQAIDETKNRLFSIIGHDLRAPLASIKAVLGLLQMKALSAEEQQIVLKDLTLRLDLANHTLDNLLAWGKGQLQRVQFVAEPRWVNLHQEAQYSINLWADAAAHKQLTLHNELPATLELWVDVEHLRLILRNLLNNAIKFTPNGGHIRIEEATAQGWQGLTVTDTGIGMDAEIQAQIFDSQDFVSTRGTANEKGTGLGLQLCLACAKANGGTIKVNSQLGKGTSFTLLLPQG
ncbi:tetratricopeptide repeat-containing sensor histidine kinase [Eisenibacter elegans]|uniref:ATP-binding protein n=1 Tax=Eisenibacter elegans TaxID=997 RepID=UPI00047D47D6|nr:tetratricopeptide repeat-containing sensor histidine kinase [Eisenibacter elegans]